MDKGQVRRFYSEERPEYVFVAAARVGGIRVNEQQPAQFLYENLEIQNSLIHGAYEAGVKKTAFPGQFVYLPETGAATDEGGVFSKRSAGADQPMVWRGENSRYQDVPGVPAAVRM